MLTEHEQLADHEARISRQELPPLQQPLDNIEEIKQALNHDWQPFETAPGDVMLLWYIPEEKRYMVGSKGYAAYVFYEENCEDLVWQHFPPPPKDENV